MRRRVLMYLEDYARRLSDEVASLREQCTKDHDDEAGDEAETLAAQVRDVRKIVAFLSARVQFID